MFVSRMEQSCLSLQEIGTGFLSGKKDIHPLTEALLMCYETEEVVKQKMSGFFDRNH